nr:MULTISPECIES: FxsA family protein [Bartonella]
MLVAIFIEIAGFIIVGKEIGVLATLALIILSMFVGFILLRIQGITLLAKMQHELSAGRIPDRELAHGALLILAAILLIIPGFVTDIIGLLLFIPQIRDLLWKWVSKKMTVRASFSSGFRENSYDNNHSQTIDLDAEDYHSSDPEHSPWRKDDDNKRLN